MTDDPESEHIKEVYARFGLALYYAQVLEHETLALDESLPFRRTIEASNGTIRMQLRQFMQRTRPEKLATEDTTEEARKEVKVQKAAMVHHDGRPATGTKHAVHFCKDLAGACRVVDDTPRPDKVK